MKRWSEVNFEEVWGKESVPNRQGRCMTNSNSQFQIIFLFMEHPKEADQLVKNECYYSICISIEKCFGCYNQVLSSQLKFSTTYIQIGNIVKNHTIIISSIKMPFSLPNLNYPLWHVEITHLGEVCCYVDCEREEPLPKPSFRTLTLSRISVIDR